MCDVESVEDTEIVCLIADSGKVHAVTNLGTHEGTTSCNLDRITRHQYIVKIGFTRVCIIFFSYFALKQSVGMLLLGCI